MRRSGVVIPAEDDSSPHTLIDIQTKLSQANSPGFERWAKTYNLKEIAKTVVWMKEHGINDVKKLAEGCDAAAVKYNTLSEKTKTNERRMREISELQKQIGTYSKTREVYAQYKKLPLQKREEFYETNRTSIMLHEASKRYFDSLGLEKLPSIRELKREYAMLSAENKQLYPSQKKARKDMVDLLTAKCNVEKFLDIKVEQPGRKKKQPEESL